MKFLPLIITALSIVSANPTFACSFASGTDRFIPDLEYWEPLPGPAQKGKKGDYWEKIPAPIVRNINITRGTEAPGSSCNDAGTLTLKVSLPSQSNYSIADFGVYFRVIQGTAPDEIFPDIPLVGEIKGKKSEFFLAWLDGHPTQHKPIDLTVEVFFVSTGLNVGSSSTIKIKG